MTSKRGEITSKQIVTIVILLFSFVIILLFYWAFNWTGQITQETCHESIVMRSTFNAGGTFGEVGRSTIPLNCQIEKICFTQSDANCNSMDMVDTPGNSVKKIKLSKDSTKAREEYLDTLANALYDCHSMLGEGKLDFMPSTTWVTSRYCFLCSRIAIEKSVAEANPSQWAVSAQELFKYLDTKKTPSGKSYLTYIYGKTYTQIMSDWQKLIEERNAKQGTHYTLSDTYLFTNHPGAIIASLFEESKVSVLSGEIFWGGVFGSTFKKKVYEAAGKEKFTEVSYSYSYPLPYSYDAETLKKLQCSSFESIP